MYKQDYKSQFLNQFENEHTKKVYEAVFKKSEPLEAKYNTDIMDFGKDELQSFIINDINPKTKQSARTYCHILSSYIQWGIDNEYSKNEKNPLDLGSSYFEKFVENQDALYLSKGEIDAIVFNLVNAQDSFIIKALFEGIQGKQLSELINLTIDDIEDAYENDNMLKLTDGISSRYIKVENDTLKLAELAYKEKEYYKKNGELDYSENVKDRIDLSISKYILRPSATNSEKVQITHYSVYNRLEMVKSLEDFEEYKDSLTTKNIVRSGMLYEAMKIVSNGGELNKKAIESICSKYGIKYKWSLKDFLNVNTINEVYGLM